MSLPSESVTEVRTNIYVTSFGPVSDTDMVSVFLFSFLLTLIIAVISLYSVYLYLFYFD